MGMFVIRIQLTDANNYRELHKAMAARGFSTLIKMSDGKRYKMPHAEYFFQDATSTTEEVHTKAQAALAAVEDENAIAFTCKVETIIASNLKQPDIGSILLQLSSS
jgi:hypothetical protein